MLPLLRNVRRARPLSHLTPFLNRVATKHFLQHVRTFSAAAAIRPAKVVDNVNMPTCPHDGRPQNIPANVWQRIGANLHQRPDHPIGILKSLVENVMRGRTGDNFEIYDDFSPVCSVKGCFDDLLTPKDHVSRSTSDTFYVDGENVLRTHATAHQSDLLREGKRAVLWTSDVYRKDEIDRLQKNLTLNLKFAQYFLEIRRSFKILFLRPTS